MKSVAVGDTVRVVRNNQRNPGEYDGTVTKVARRYVTVVAEGYNGGRPTEFDMGTGRLRGGRAYGTGPDFFNTLAEAEQVERERRVRDVFARSGLRDDGHRLTLEQQERIAALLESFEGERR